VSVSPSGFVQQLQNVVQNGNCCGCGGCAVLSGRVSLAIDLAGHLVPSVSEEGGSLAGPPREASFESVCPGIRVVALPSQGRWHPVFGSYLRAWAGEATDPRIRRAGSSAGVLSAFSDWLIRTGQVDSAVMAAAAEEDASFTAAVVADDRASVLAASGSRYAPVSTLARHDLSSRSAFVGRPCEASALRALLADSSSSGAEAPPILSFFCAGVPSQRATAKILEILGVSREKVRTLRYRGNGWPGDFTVEARDGLTKHMSYEESWGRYLGRSLPWRCKICADGTGGAADVVAGDYWQADSRGFPLFDDSDGRSVVIARTERGLDLVERARADGVLKLSTVDLDDVARMQPLQTVRKRTLLFRLAGRRIAGYRTPSYVGFRLVKASLWGPQRVARALFGTIVRSWQFPGAGGFKRRWSVGGRAGDR
jgi:coenzyme F420 hydrogenase subunit beta